MRQPTSIKSIVKELSGHSCFDSSLEQVEWAASKHDESITAILDVKTDKVTAVLMMNYLGKNIQMVKLILSPTNKPISDGFLYKDDVNLAIKCFKTHVQNMQLS